MDALRRADNETAYAAGRWRYFLYKLRHPFRNQEWRIRHRLNYINPFYYLGHIKNNIKYMITGHY
ncbi:hypothetical protein M758_3G198600 [Ceratodon purpureus]|nr:hypothetical protein M758_3G198600 [Ceratodon purpureus]KAG0623749.1 hypothetical protein M758_3G198600 [Ceratodon purpureus]